MRNWELYRTEDTMRIVVPVIDRSKFPTANDEYTPQQRRIIDARLAESDVAGPFAQQSVLPRRP